MHSLAVCLVSFILLIGCERRSTEIIVDRPGGVSNSERALYSDGNSVSGASDRGAFAIKNDSRSACYSIADQISLEPLCI